MQPRLYRTTLAAAPRLFNEFGVPLLGKMMNRGMRSITDGNSANSDTNFAVEKVSKRSKRRTRIDLGSKEVQNIGTLQYEASNLKICSKQKMEAVHNISPLQCEASTSISDHYDTDLPTSFGRKKPRNPKLCQTNQEHREAKRRSKPSSSTPIDEPFDICPPETTESTTLGSCVANEEGNYTQDLVEKSGLVLRPGMVLFKHYIPLSEQVSIVNRCRELGCGLGGFYRPGYNDGAKLRLYMMCLGLDWDPQTRKYVEKRHHDNAVPPDLPNEFTSLVGRVLADSRALIERNQNVGNVEVVLPTMIPDVCIVNFYTTNGRLGLHQDRDESQKSLDEGLPVVSISIGDSAEFLYCDQRDVNKAENVLLESGDVLIFGGESRHIFHGVKTIVPDSAPPPLLEYTKLRPGRLNLTFRQHEFHDL